ncbi:TIGR03885 family FMN-dependent LLM class oxidoreductase [Aridibaculum aurantiacum]|uniref:TIGR03885 family FMN-dependent LLM class oxidoreductase n=1 Tax=Aridibaculum aurantiacum TaxID=2810307 RepID=UPI001A958405|nr:TIGR03885 family FMN-dependent LLM class oxidoreductase [Aridibaculum aurantiacum]
MAIIGYHASHEQFAPSELLRLAVMAEQAGFGAINSSDHFHPWSERQGHSGYSFSWLGASMASTSLPHGVVCAPGQRNHVAIVAQAAATLSEMFPERFWMSVGSGEALNENITGDKWIMKAQRNERLKECVDIMRRLFAGEMVTHYGLVTVQQAKLYSLPKVPPLLIGAAVTDVTARWLGSWADGLITINHPLEQLKKVVEAFREGGGKGKPLYLKAQLSYARNEERALEEAYDQWRTNVLSSEVLDDLWQVKQYDALGEMVTREKVKELVKISSDPQQHIKWIQEYVDLGFEKIILHNVGKNQEEFIKDFGEHVLPKFK